MTDSERFYLYDYGRAVAAERCREVAGVDVSKDLETVHVTVRTKDCLKIERTLAPSQFALVLAGTWGLAGLDRLLTS